MAETPKMPKAPKPKAASTPKVSKPTTPTPPPEVTPGAGKTLSSPQLTNQQIQEEEELSQQASVGQQRSKAAAGQKTSAMKRRAQNIRGNALKSLDEYSKSDSSDPDASLAKRGVQQVGKDAAKVASSTIKGAMRGGLAGAGTGAAKGVVKSKSFWVAVAAVTIIPALFIGGLASLLLFGLTGDTDTAQESFSRSDAGQEASESAAESFTGHGSLERRLQHIADTTGADFYILNSALREEDPGADDDGRPDDGWFGLTDDAIDELVEDIPGAQEPDDLDIEDEARWLSYAIAREQRDAFGSDATSDLAAGYTLAVTPGGRDPISGQDQLRNDTFDTWVETVEALPIVDAGSKADSIVTRARDWKVGGTEPAGGAVCVPSGADGDSSGATGTVNIPDEYVSSVEDAAAESGFSANVIGAQIQAESNWNPNARSPVGAMGAAQFMPGTWESFGDGGDPWDAHDSIAAQGRYMKYLRDFMEPHADDEEHLLRLVLAGYNAGQGNVQKYNFDLDVMLTVGGFRSETKPYIERIIAASDGDYTSDCEPSGAGGDVPTGDVVEASMYLAWDNMVTLPSSMAHGYGRSAAKPEFVEVSTSINPDTHTAYFTDCGVFVSTVMRSSGADESFPIRGTAVMQSYLRGSDKYETFHPSSVGDLQSGDILFLNGHIFIYTGERHSGIDGSSQGASLSTRPPSGHITYLSDNRGGYEVARLVSS